ncbi:MAG: right-handed parallel beta-helix repeat-containing protein, partial [Gammaproteobacteria bacterium]|nr:right-handed parallel beta-helix repeat-containing protein [Gammaproteobacteria bacterium]
SCAGSTDTSNPYGYPAKPRKTMPSSLPAGSVVELSGQIDTDLSFTAQGTAGNPVFVRGASSASRPKLTASQDINGSYVILENIWWGPQNSSDSDIGVLISEGNHHIAIRNCEFSGTSGGAGGIGIGSWGYTGSQSASYIVIDNCNIHDIGDVNASGDQDAHGITVNGSVDNLWVTYNQISYTSGDAMQIEAQQGRRAKIHHVYYGKNHAHHNKQTGGWVKHATDVIFSQNIIHDHRSGNSSFGQCTGFQYGPEYVWFLFNRIYSCDVGIGLASNDPPGDGVNAYVIGNVIYDIHTSTTNPYNSGAIMAYGGNNLHFINNTISDVDSGINLPPGWNSVQIYNNIINNRTKASGYDIYVESNVNGVTIQNNIFTTSPRFYWSGATYSSLSSFISNTGKGQNSLSTDPQFVAATSRNFELQSTSPAIDTGVLHAAYATFKSRYGIDISQDISGGTRPVGVGYDMGAHEFGASTVRPSAPAKLQAQPI